LEQSFLIERSVASHQCISLKGRPHEHSRAEQRAQPEATPEGPPTKLSMSQWSSWIVICRIRFSLMLARILLWFGFEDTEARIGLFAIAITLIGGVVTTWQTAGDYEHEFLESLQRQDLVSTKAFLSAIQKQTSGPAVLQAASFFLFLILARPIVDAFRGNWQPIVFFAALIAAMVVLVWLVTLARSAVTGPVSAAVGVLVLAFGLAAISYLLEGYLRKIDIGPIAYSVRLLTMLALGMVAWVGLVFLGFMIHELLPLVQHYNRSRDRMLRRSPSLQNPLSLLEAFLLDSILRYWVISFAFAPLLYAAGKFLPVAFIFFVLSFALMVPTFLGCVRALAEAPKSAYLQLPRLCLPYAIFVVISMNLAVLCGYAAAMGCGGCSIVCRSRSAFVPSQYALLILRQVPPCASSRRPGGGAVIAVTLMMFLSWLVVVWKKRAYGHVAGVSLIVAALASKQALQACKERLARIRFPAHNYARHRRRARGSGHCRAGIFVARPFRRHAEVQRMPRGRASRSRRVLQQLWCRTGGDASAWSLHIDRGA
jgi:hypothetical protein